jgi:RND family efflux transporter MFP subunit
MKGSVFLVSLLSLLLVACGDEVDLAEKDILRPVRVMQIGEADNLNGRQFSAVIEAEKQAQLSFGIAGKVEIFDIVESQPVKQGDVLAQMDATDVKITLIRKQADYDKANANYKRGKILVKSGTISRSDFDQLKASYFSADSQLKASQQNLKYTKIVAPFDGIIVERFVKEFEEVNAKQPIVELQDLSNLLIKINVSEKVMQKSRRPDGERSFHVQFDNYKDKKFPVKLKEAVTRADEVSQTFEVTFALPTTKDIQLLPGMTGLLIVEQSAKSGSEIFIPANTVLSDGQGRYVFLLDVDTQNVGRVKRINIKVDELTANGLKIHSGLNQGDLLITAGMTQLTDGMKVKVPADLLNDDL